MAVVVAVVAVAIPPTVAIAAAVAVRGVVAATIVPRVAVLAVAAERLPGIADRVVVAGIATRGLRPLRWRSLRWRLHRWRQRNWRQRCECLPDQWRFQLLVPGQLSRPAGGRIHAELRAQTTL